MRVSPIMVNGPLPALGDRAGYPAASRESARGAVFPVPSKHCGNPASGCLLKF
jgi:hypothetical protein